MIKRLLFLLVCLTVTVGSLSAKVIKGTVIDGTTDDPIPGATILCIGATTAVGTDIDGNFSIDVPSNVKTIRVNYLGMIPQELTVADLVNPVVVKLMPQDNKLEEVVVVAYGTQKKSSITGAISQVDSKEIELRPVSSVSSALEGTTSGITVSGNYGSPGESPTVLIRGIGTVNGSTSPLYVVDGVPMGGNVTDLNPNDIESMSVLKDAASCALYGNRASNGVILITTKKARGEKLRINLKINQGWYQRGIPEYDRTDAYQWMGVEYQNWANSYISTNGIDRTDATAMQGVNDYVNSTLVPNRIILNIFNRGDEELFDSNGKFTGTSIVGTYSEDLDWFDQAIRSGNRSEYLLSGSGATNKSDYLFSIGYLDENGYMKDSGYNRFSARANINVAPVKWLKTGLNLSVSHQNYDNTSNGVGDGSTSYNNQFFFCRYISPIYPVHLHYKDGSQRGQYILNAAGDLQFDPGYYIVTEDGYEKSIATRNQYVDRHVIWESELNKSRSVRNTINGIAYADIMLPYGITATVKGNLNTRNSEYFKYNSAVIGDSKARNGSLTKTLYNYKTYTFMQQLHWNYSFADLHTLNLLAGHENYNNQYDYTYVTKEDQAFPNVYALSNFAKMVDIDGYKANYRTESYLGRVQYNYDQRYNLEASIRRDASSRFAKQTRWGTFGSIGANWVFSNEAFMKDLKWLDNGILRANWGQVGNDSGSGYYSYYALFSADTNASLPAYYLSQNAADDLKWETSEAWGIGVEAWLFNRWHIGIEYYDKRNRDLIFDVNAPLSAGATSTSSAVSTTTKNIGTVSNRGWEINTDLTLFKTKDWNINIAANLTTNQNKVVKLPDEYKSDGGYISGQYKISEGHSRYEWYTYHWAGVDMMDGQSLYEPDLEKYHIVKEDGTIVGGTKDPETGAMTSTALADGTYRYINGEYYVLNTTYGKRDFRCNALPSVYGSFTGNVSWKGIHLSAMFTYSLGGKLYDSNYVSLMSAGNAPANYHVDILNSWNGVPAGMTETSPNRINRDINPEINYLQSYNNLACDRWLTSRNYLCFKNLNVAFDLPRNWMKAVNLTNAQISVAAENLFITTARKGMNPMMGIAGGQANYLVPARVITFGLNVNI